MNFEITGVLILKENVIDVTATFRKREFVIEVVNERNSDWNDFIKFQLTQDKCAILDHFNVGDRIKVSFNIRGRKWEKDGNISYFSNLEAWRIEKNTGQEMPVQSISMPQPPPHTENDIPPVGFGEDVAPF